MNRSLDRAAIALLVPHSGAMCLLDEVLHWDEELIRCRTGTHRDPANPLARHGRVPSVCGIEYAAQAMAVHGGLTALAGARPLAGFLASVREVNCTVHWLDKLPGDLVIDAERLLGDAARVIYRFELRCGSEMVMSGRAAVVLEAAAPSAPR